MRLQRKLMVGIVLVIVAIFSTSAFGEKVKIEYWSWDVEIEGLLIQMAEDFMQINPHIEVEVLTQPWLDYWDKLAILNATGNPPDVYNMSPAYLWDYANNGLVVNLEKYVAELPQDSYFWSIMDALRYPYRDSDLYAFPFGWVTTMMYYNRSIFQEAGLNLPDGSWDWFELREVAKKLTRDRDGDGVNDIWGYFSSSSHEVIDAAIYSWGGAVLDSKRQTSLLTDEKSIEAIQFFVDLIHVDRVAPPPGVGASFVDGTLAMWPAASYNISSLVDHYSDLDWAVALMPAGPEERLIYGAPDNVVISSHSKHPDEAWEFVKYLTGPQRAANTDFRGRVPIHRELALDPEWARWSGGIERNVLAILESSNYFGGMDFGSTKWVDWRWGAMDASLAHAFSGESSVQNAASIAAEQINAILSSTVCTACE